MEKYDKVMAKMVKVSSCQAACFDVLSLFYTSLSYPFSLFYMMFRFACVAQLLMQDDCGGDYERLLLAIMKA